MKEFHFNQSYSRHNRSKVVNPLFLIDTIGAFVLGVVVLGTMVYLLVYQRTLTSIGAHIMGSLILSVVVLRIHMYMNHIDSVIIDNDKISVTSTDQDNCIPLADLEDFDIVRWYPWGMYRVVFTVKNLQGVEKKNYYIIDWIWKKKALDHKLDELESELISIISKNKDTWRR